MKTWHGGSESDVSIFPNFVDGHRWVIDRLSVKAFGEWMITIGVLAGTFCDAFVCHDGGGVRGRWMVLSFPLQEETKN